MELHAKDVAMCDTGREAITILGCANHHVLTITLKMIGMNVIKTRSFAHFVKQAAFCVACVRPTHVGHFLATVNPGYIEAHRIHWYPVEPGTVSLLAPTAQQLGTKANAENRHTRVKDPLIQHLDQTKSAQGFHREAKVSNARKEQPGGLFGERGSRAIPPPQPGLGNKFSILLLDPQARRK